MVGIHCLQTFAYAYCVKESKQYHGECPMSFSVVFGFLWLDLHAIRQTPIQFPNLCRIFAMLLAPEPSQLQYIQLGFENSDLQINKSRKHKRIEFLIRGPGFTVSDLEI